MPKKLKASSAIWLIAALLLLSFPKSAFAHGEPDALEQDVNGYHITLMFPEAIIAGENQLYIQIADSLGAPVANADVSVSTMLIDETTHAVEDSHSDASPDTHDLDGAENSHSDASPDTHNLNGAENSHSDASPDIHNLNGVVMPTEVPHASTSPDSHTMAGMDMPTEVPHVSTLPDPHTMTGLDMSTESPASAPTSNEHAPDEHEAAALMLRFEPTSQLGVYAGQLTFAKSGEWKLNVHFTIEGETTQADFQVEIVRVMSLNYTVLATFVGINATVITLAAIRKRKSVVRRK